MLDEQYKEALELLGRFDKNFHDPALYGCSTMEEVEQALAKYLPKE